VGVRYKLQGRAPVAVAGFGGSTIGLAAVGAPRTRLSGTVEAGLDAQVAPGVALFVSGIGEFSGRANRAGVNGGVKVLLTLQCEGRSGESRASRAAGSFVPGDRADGAIILRFIPRY